MKSKYLIMNSWKIYLQVFLLILSNFLIAQNKQINIAHSAPKGIYIDLGIDIVNKSYPTNKVCGYKVERQAEKETGWKNIATVQLPYTKEDAYQKLIESSRILFPTLDLNRIPFDSLWIRIEYYHRLDSLGVWSGFLPLRISTGTMYYDQDLKENEKYLYRISTINSAGDVIRSVESNSVSVPGKYSGQRLVVSLIKRSEREINVTWSSSIDFKPSNIYVFKSERADSNFNQLNIDVFSFVDNDSVYFTINDTIISANNYYRYNAVPVDLYGNTGNKSKDMFAFTTNFSRSGYPYIVNAASIDSLNAIELSWQFQKSDLVDHVEIYKSKYFDSGFVKIADVSSNQLSYLDYDIQPMKKYEYYIRSVNRLEEFSIPSVKVFGILNSTEVPAPPQNIQAVSLPNGVKLQWTNSEDFIEGFWVFRSDNTGDSLQLISSMIKEENPYTIFYDTSGVSGKLTYSYSIKSSSTSHVLSNFSDTVSVRPEIKTLPPSPLGLTVQMDTDSSSIIMWQDMTENDNSIWGYSIERKIIEKNGKSDFIQLTDSLLPFTQNSFVDKTIIPGNKYEYRVVAYDIYGGQSDPSIISFEYQLPGAIRPEGLVVTKSENGIELNWSESLQKKIKQFNVYRQTRDSDPKLIGSVKAGNEMKIIDKAASDGKLYFYYVTTVNEYGLESEPGKIVSIIP